MPSAANPGEAPQVTDTPPPPPRLCPEHWLILAVMAVIMAFALGWGLPDASRLALLNWGQDPTPQEMRQLSDARDSYYNELDSLQAESGRRLLHGQPASLGDPVSLTAVLSPAERGIAWRSYLLGSNAVDERYSFSVLSRMNPAKGDFNPRRHNYGGSFIYPLGALLYAQKLLGLLQATPDLSHYLARPQEIARMYLTGRAFSVLALLGIIYLLGLWGQRLGGRAAASLAMLAFALSSVTFWQALITKPHLYAAFFGFLGLYWLARHRQEGGTRLLIQSAAACGWAAGASLPAGALALAYPLLLARSGQGWRWLGPVALAGVVMAAVFLLTNPYAVLSPETYAYTLTLHGSSRGFGYGVFGLLKMKEYLHDIFTRSYTLPLGLLGGLCALGLALLGRGLERRLALLFIVLTLLVGGTVATPRITLFTGPLLCLLAGLGLQRWLLRPAWAAPGIKAGLLGLLLLPGLCTLGLMAHDAIWDRAWYQPTRQWVHTAGITPATSFGTFGRPDPTNLPPFPFLHHRLVNLFDFKDPAQAPDYVLLGNFQDDQIFWQKHPLRDLYRPVAELGWRPSWQWLAAWRQPSEARLAAWVYQRRP
ncbi:MAG: hypothetical protein V1806_15590 [Pseudomonadota bacterium]